MSDGWAPLELQDDVQADTIIEARAGSRSLVAVLHDGRWSVFADLCTHAECAFADYGEVVAEDGVIVCNCHGAEFSLVDGAVMLEPAEIPLTLLPVRVAQDGELEVRLD